MLVLENVCAGYGQTPVLHGVSLRVPPGGCVSLLGRNGVGKTTTVRAIMGQIPLGKGKIARFGDATQTRETFEIARAGVGLVPEGRMIFGNLSVREHLETFIRPPCGDQPLVWTVARVLELFPRLQQRLDHPGNLLSGGEQQMLAIARALVINPRLLILDEATEGLAPLVRQQIWQILTEIKQAGLAILIIDKNLQAIAKFADWHYILEKGRVVWNGDSAALQENTEIASRFLGV